MTSEEERLYTRYCYNAVIEFICFINLYIEAYGAASLSALIKYVKFFKIEVNAFISIFEGKSEEEKLLQMLNAFDCFEVLENKVQMKENVNLNCSIFEEFIISKCVDLLLKGWNNIDDICKNLNSNCVIKISKRNFLQIIKKYSYISVCENHTIALNHVHGLLGFEDYLHNSVIGYFHNILYYDKILSFNEIRNHVKSLSFCGMSNAVGIFSMFNCSSQFDCQNGYILLKKKRKKHPKKKLLDVERMESNFSSRSLPVGQIVYSAYGSFLQQWSGEIGTLTASSGVICCVVDFKNGYQGVFNVYFNKTALKVISEIDNLTKNLNVRDVVEFDAEYYNGKKLDRCWKATRVKLLSSTKFQYDELLSNKLSSDTVIQRNNCTNSMCCSNIYPPMKGIVSSSSNSIDQEYREKQLNGSLVSISNTLLIDYIIMFGHIYILMKDKGIAIAEHEGKFYNILFMRDSIYPSNKSEPFFKKSQKVLVFIPYLQKMDSFCIATLIYGLNGDETTETDHVSPKEFAVKTFLSNTVRNLCSKFCNSCNFFNGLQAVKLENFDTDLQYKLLLAEQCDFITKQYKVSFADYQLLLLLHSIYKENLNGEKFSNKIFRFMIKLSKCLTNYSNQEKLKIKKKRKLIKRIHNNHKSNSQVNSLQELCIQPLIKKGNSVGCIPASNLSVKSNSLDVLQCSLSSLNSFKTCSASSFEVFYSCESMVSSLSSSSLHNSNCDSLPCKMQTGSEFELAVPLPTVMNNKCSILSINSSQELKMETQHNFKSSKCHKYLSLQSIPPLKYTIKKRKKVAFPYSLRTSCKNCVQNCLKVTGSISLISKSFYFFTTNIDGHNVVLPLPKQDISLDLQRKIKLNSSSEITVIPSILVNLSHVTAARIAI